MMNEGISLFLQRMRCLEGSKPDYDLFATLLKSCATTSNIKLGKALHSHVVKLGHRSCQLVSKALLNMYAKCKALDDCQRLFAQNSSNDAVTWNIVLSGFSVSRVHDNEVMRWFYAMHLAEEPKPNPVSIATVLPVCARLRALGAGRSVHGYAVKNGLESNTLVGNSLISLYAKSGRVCDDAYTVFRGIKEKDVVSWNAMIAGFAENKYIGEAFTLFRWMLQESEVPNYATIANILAVCAGLEEKAAYHFGKEIHCYVLQRAELMDHVSVSNALLSFYSRIGLMREAEYLFLRMRSKDLVTWNSVIAGYATNGEFSKALELFHKLVSDDIVVPDSVTVLSILPACAYSYDLQAGKQIHGYLFRHPWLLEETAVGNALIHLYAKCDDTEAANRTFSLISKRDLISWNSMLDAYAESRFEVEFVDHLNSMLMKGIKPDTITIISVVQFCATLPRLDKVKEAHGYSIRSGIVLGNIEPTVGNTLINAYAKCGNLAYGLRIFERLSGKKNVGTYNSLISVYVNCGSQDNAHMIFTMMPEKDLATWNLMVRLYAENDSPDEALALFFDLQKEGFKPDAMSIMSLLPVCSQMASIRLLRQCHGYAVRACFNDNHLNAALLDLYSKCGSINCAYNLFRSSFQKDLVIFTAMVGGYAMHGMVVEALEVYNNMLALGVKPDHVIITAILSACSRVGLVNEGLRIFDSVEKVHGLEPTMEQYGCVVDLLARGGRVKDAYTFANQMPVEASANIWGTLLGACRTHDEVEMGRDVANRLFEVDTENIGNYVVMSNLYAANERWDGVLEMRKLIKTRDVKKPAGQSWIEVEGRNNVFVAGDSSHPQKHVIYSTLCNLHSQVKELFEN